MNKKEFILSIETAVQGGSISLLRGNDELDCWIGTREISKSEDVLEEIKKILERNDLEKERIKKIVVSRGPGSYTGVRIGMAVAYGLTRAFDCELVGVSVLDGLLLTESKNNVSHTEEIITAVPIGRNQVYWQNFKGHRNGKTDNPSQVQFSIIEDFFKTFDNSEFQLKKKVILHRKLYIEFKAGKGSPLSGNCSLLDAGTNIAVLIGMTGAGIDDNKMPHPIYVRESRLCSEL
jgi:tRNA threonylcarbamoyl adenosine modification protein YeaZ